MKLAHLEYFHRAIWYGSILAAVFFGMLVQYNMKRIATDAERATLVSVYTKLPITALTELEI